MRLQHFQPDRIGDSYGIDAYGLTIAYGLLDTAFAMSHESRLPSQQT